MTLSDRLLLWVDFEKRLFARQRIEMKALMKSEFFSGFMTLIIIAIFPTSLVFSTHPSTMSELALVGVFLIFFSAVMNVMFAWESAGLLARKGLYNEYVSKLTTAEQIALLEKNKRNLLWEQHQDLKRLKQQLADELAATQKQPE